MPHHGGPPIKIGTTLWANPEVSLTSRLPGIKAAIREINGSGGINGRKIVWDYCPVNSNDPNAVIACAHKMVSDGVVATVGDADILAEAQATQILDQAGIPQIDPFVNSTAAMTSPNVFLLDGGLTLPYAAAVQFMHLKGLKSLHFITAGVPTSADIQAATATAAKYYGIQDLGSTDVPFTAPDFQPYVAAAASAGGSVQMPIIAPFQSNLLLQATQQLGKHFTFGLQASQFTLNQVKQYGKPGGPLSNAVLTDSAPPLSAASKFPGIKQYETDLAAEYKAGDKAADVNNLLSISLYTWMSVKIFAQLAAKLPTITAATVTKAFQTAKNIKTGVIPPWTPSAKGPAGYTQISNPWMYLITVKNGQEVLYQDKPINVLAPFEKK
jgi:branched-chain amino acid transport system substrate-binding protein